MSEAVLDIHALSCGYGEAMVVRGVAIQVLEGEIFALLGKNGMGKSTLLKALMGYLPIKGGCVKLFGEDVTGLPPYRLARRAISYTPQEQALFQDLTVEENLRLGLHDGKGLEAGLQRIEPVFPFLLQRRKQRAGSLSGGEQKMLLVARALISRPRLLLIDEISEGLQPSVIERLSAVLRSERDASGTSMLIVEQNVKFALSAADRYAVLKLGEISDCGKANESGVEVRITDQLGV